MMTIRVGRGETKILLLTCVEPDTGARKDLGGFRIVAVLAVPGSKDVVHSWSTDLGGVDIRDQNADATKGQALITMDDSETITCSEPRYDVTVLIYDENSEPHVVVTAQPLAFFDVPGVTP